MKKLAVSILVLIFLVCSFGISSGGTGKQKSQPQKQGLGQGQLPGRFADKGIVVGLEYVVFNKNGQSAINMADTFAETGMTGMKHIAETFRWDTMQKGPNQPIDFSMMDLYVREFQKKGFTELTLCLSSYSKWASKETRLFKRNNWAPKPQYKRHYGEWIYKVVKRYDGDGKEDMEGLRWPVRYIEIGSEFSSYEPEPVEDYLEMLKIAYQAAHRASQKVLVGHAAFLISPVHLDVTHPRDYDRVWAETKRRDTHHDLKDQRKVLDHPELFDFINIHNLVTPYEIEYIMKWLKYETDLRKYKKPVVISDTSPTPYIGFGPGTVCKGKEKDMGLICWPVTDADRCRLAEFFKKLIAKDKAILAWTRGFVAADQVQRTVIAAEQGIKLINLSFTADIDPAKWKAFKAAAGLSAWGGAVRLNFFTWQVVEKYPLFYAIKQMMHYLNGYASIKRVKIPDDHARVYLLNRQGRKFWIAWRNPLQCLLPEDGEPKTQITLHTGVSAVTIEHVITGMGQRIPKKEKVPCSNGKASLTLTHTPIYIFPM